MSADSPLDQALAQLEGFRAALGDAAIDAAAQALRQHASAPSEPRLRPVSVLFADIADSTAMLGRVATEDAMALLGEALQGFTDAVQHAGGQVLRYTGDGIKAAFGMQRVREDEAERAVHAGLQMLAFAQQHALRVEQTLGVQGFGVRVGIHTGPVLVGGGVEAERFASFSPGMCFGETAVLDGGGRTADAVADCASVVHRLHAADFDALQVEDPALAALLYRNLARHLSARLRAAAAGWRRSAG